MKEKVIQTDVIIPASVTGIGWGAFIGCSGLTNVMIPESVTRIGDGAFSSCSGIRDVTISQYVCTNRMSSLFPAAYQSITNVVIRDGVTNIEGIVTPVK